MLVEPNISSSYHHEAQALKRREELEEGVVKFATIREAIGNNGMASVREK